MIVIRVEMWPGGHEAKARELMLMHITNDGTGTETRGNYFARVFRKGGRNKILCVGRIEDFPRQSYHVGRLVLRALAACFPEERGGDD